MISDEQSYRKRANSGRMKALAHHVVQGEEQHDAAPVWRRAHNRIYSKGTRRDAETTFIGPEPDQPF
jgi:hypothetical protein